METNLVPVEVKAILPAKTGVAVFIGDDQKVFLIYVDHSVGAAITMFLQGVKKERPLTHDLIQRIFRSLGIGVERAAPFPDLLPRTFNLLRLVLRFHEFSTLVDRISAPARERNSSCSILPAPPARFRA